LLLVAFISAWLALGRLYRATASDRRATVTTHQVACLLVWVTFNAIVDKGFAGPLEVFMVAMVATWTLGKQAMVHRSDLGTVPTEIRGAVTAARGRR
jgi:hypothetical protein